MRRIMGTAAIVLLGWSAAQAENVVIATEAAFEPFAYVDGSGNLVGFEIELGNAVCERAKLACEWQNVPWDGLFTGLEAGKFDAVMAGVMITEDRKTKFAFSEPYFVDAAAFVAPKGAGIVPTREGLDGYTVATITGSTMSKFVKANWPEVELREYPSFDEAWADLEAGRVDVLLGIKSQLVGGYLSDPENAEAFEIVGELQDPGYPETKFGVVFNLADHPHLDDIQAALAALEADGTLKSLTEKYFPGLAPPRLREALRWISRCSHHHCSGGRSSRGCWSRCSSSAGRCWRARRSDCRWRLRGQVGGRRCAEPRPRIPSCSAGRRSSCSSTSSTTASRSST